MALILHRAGCFAAAAVCRFCPKAAGGRQSPTPYAVARRRAASAFSRMRATS